MKKILWILLIPFLIGATYTPNPLPVTDNGGSLTVDGTVGVSGTVTVDGSGVTQPVSAASLPLPTGAATAANQQTDALTDTELRATPVPVSGTITANLSATDNAVLDSIDAAVNGTLTVDGSGVTQPISALSLPLPTGAATAANQVTLQGYVDQLEGYVDGIETLLGTIDADTSVLSATDFMLGTDFSNVFGASSLISGGRVLVDGSGVTQPVSGTVTANQGGSWSVTSDTEMPAAAAMADAQANPTVPHIGAELKGYNGSTWDRIRSAGDNADGISTVTLGRLTINSKNQIFNGSTWDRQRGDTTGTYVHGGTAHDAVDAGNPIKIGGKAFNLAPSTPGTRPGQTAVAANDRVNAQYGLQGEITEHPVGIVQQDTSIDTVYDDSPTTVTGNAYDAYPYRFFTVGTCVTASSAFASGTIQFYVEVSPDNSVWFILRNGGLSQWTFSSAYTNASEKCDSYSFTTTAYKIRIRAVASNTTASNTFTVDDTYIEMSN